MAVGGGSTVLQTSLNVAKICTSMGTLTLPYASEKGGILFNANSVELLLGELPAEVRGAHRSQHAQHARGQ
jgi:hypothetical protein